MITLKKGIKPFVAASGLECLEISNDTDQKKLVKFMSDNPSFADNFDVSEEKLAKKTK